MQVDTEARNELFSELIGSKFNHKQQNIKKMLTKSNVET
jgi:hypothetical protein